MEATVALEKNLNQAVWDPNTLGGPAKTLGECSWVLKKKLPSGCKEKLEQKEMQQDPLNAAGLARPQWCLR